MRWMIALAFVAAGGTVASAQETEELRRDLLELIRSRLGKAREEMVHGVGKILAEELKPEETGLRKRIEAKRKELRRKLAELRIQERKIRLALLYLKWLEKDSALAEQVRRSGLEPRDAQQLFQDSLNAHYDEDYDVSIPGFKKIYYAWCEQPDARLREFACVSAYNVACGYSLAGQKEEALDWLELSCALGALQHSCQCHDNFRGHIDEDTDLDNIRKEPRFKAILKRYTQKN